ncbi:hypothetical protein [Alteriqipengyuania sp.]|uniref:hypothetical protein n=1 Tax=Alteriqipengyuania sp. TaxID=2800692 RepID=UPI003513CEBD
MGEDAGAEGGQPIDRPSIYRTLVLAFAVWALHFMIAYGAVLVFPGQAIARWIAVAAGIVACAGLLFWARRLPRASLAFGAIGLAVAAIILGTFPAIVG